MREFLAAVVLCLLLLGLWVGVSVRVVVQKPGAAPDTTTYTFIGGRKP